MQQLLYQDIAFHRLQLGTERGIGGSEAEGVDEGPEMETRSAGDDNDRRCGFGQHTPAEPTKSSDRELLPRVGDVDEMMWDAPALQHRRLGGSDVHAPVDLHRVDGDDLSLEMLGQADGCLGLARSGWPEQGQEPGQTGLPTR